MKYGASALPVSSVLFLSRVGEALMPQHGEQLQFVVALGAGRSGEYEQCLALVLGEQRLAVQLCVNCLPRTRPGPGIADPPITAPRARPVRPHPAVAEDAKPAW